MRLTQLTLHSLCCLLSAMRRMRSLFVVMAVVCALSVVRVDAHTRLLNTGYPIRNAASATADGAYSVSGPCGGVSTYGKTGVSSVASASLITVKIAYNGGHQDAANAFHAALFCSPDGISVGSTFNDAVLKVGATQGTFMKLANGQTSVPAADSSTAGYSLTFTMPVNAGAAPQDCVVSLSQTKTAPHGSSTLAH